MSRAVRVERCIRPAVAGIASVSRQISAEAMEVLGGVVRAEIGPVSPERPVLHEAVLEEDLLAAEDVVPGEERRAPSRRRPARESAARCRRSRP